MKNIQTRLLLSLIPLILVVLIALSGVSYYLAKEALSKSVDDTGRAVGTDYSQRVQADMEQMIAQLEDLASIEGMRTGIDKVKIIQAMADMQKRLGIFDVVVFFDLDGSGVASTGQMAVALAVPIMNNGQVTGVLLGTFSMERLSGMMKDLKFLDTGYGQVSDDSGIIIAIPNDLIL